jgi:outer membrane protein assembly factor BamB
MVETPGAQLWVKRFNGVGNADDNPSLLAVSPDGTKVFVTGYGYGLDFDYETVAYDAASGTELWRRNYNGPVNSKDVAYALVVSPDSTKVFVGGESNGFTESDYATVAYDAATGAELWVSRHDGTGHLEDGIRSAGVSSDGSKVFVTGYSKNEDSGEGMETIAYDATTGAELWLSRYQGGAVGTSIGVSGDGTTVFVTGAPNYATVAYEATTGTELWASFYNGPGGGSAYSLGLSPDGARVFVTGQSQGIPNYEYATVAFDASTGAQLWAQRYQGPDVGEDIAYSLEVAPDGARVFVTGKSYGGPETDLDYATIAYDATTGTELWVRRYDGATAVTTDPSVDAAAEVGVSPEGTEVYVTGVSRGMDTIAYDSATGATLWGRRYPSGAVIGAAGVGGVSLGVSPDGAKLFVTGIGVVPGAESDYITIAYSTG